MYSDAYRRPAPAPPQLNAPGNTARIPQMDPGRMGGGLLGSALSMIGPSLANRGGQGSLPVGAGTVSQFGGFMAGLQPQGGGMRPMPMPGRPAMGTPIGDSFRPMPAAPAPVAAPMPMVKRFPQGMTVNGRGSY